MYVGMFVKHKLQTQMNLQKKLNKLIDHRVSYTKQTKQQTNTKRKKKIKIKRKKYIYKINKNKKRKHLSFLTLYLII